MPYLTKEQTRQYARWHWHNIGKFRPRWRNKQRAKKYNQEYRHRPEVKLKRKAIYLLNSAVRSGKVKRDVCVVKNCNKIGEGHHPDYTKPLRVIWLCKHHHEQLHLIYKP